MQGEISHRAGAARAAVSAAVILIALCHASGCAGLGDAAEAPPEPSPQRGGVLRLVQEAPRSLDPATVDSVYESLPVNQVFDGLVAYHPLMHVVPGLASTWTISRDGRSYTFHLRQGVRFHDGTPLTATDVVYSFRRVLAPKLERRSIAFSYLAVIEGAADYAAGRRPDLPGVRALDAHTVRIVLERPYLSFLDALAMDGARIVPRHVIRARGDAGFARAPVGTGPFRLASWDDTALHLEANPDYYAGPPYLDGVHIRFLEDDENDSGAARFYGGEIDVLDAPAAQLERLTETPGVRVYRYHEMSLAFLGLLTGAPPLDRLPVRQAIAHAIDRSAMAAQSPGTRTPATGILPPGLPGYSPRTRGLEFDPERARRLLAEAGHPEGEGLKPVRIYSTSRSDAAARVLEQMRSDVEAVGIRTEVVDVSWPELSRRIEDHAAPAFLLAWVADLADPDAFLRTLFEAGSSANYFDFHDEETWKLLEEGARELHPVKRIRIYRRIERRILELAPLVPLYHSVNVLAMRERVHGLEPGPLGIASVDLEGVWLTSAAEGEDP